MSRRRLGFTMIELLLALGLFSILVVALVRLLDTSLSIWDRTEVQRDLQEMGSGVLELFARDVGALEAGPRGDLVGDWVRFDTDRDGQLGALMHRLRFVRQATAADLLRAMPRAEDDELLVPGEVRYEAIDPSAKGLLEVAWVLLPMQNPPPDQRAHGTLWRGERRLSEDSISFLDERFFSTNGKPAPGSLDPVTSGVLWFDVWYAAPTSVTYEGWELGDELSDVAASWDAWDRTRPDQEISWRNAPAAGQPGAGELPSLPRRMLVMLELERPVDVKRRTRLRSMVTHESTELVVGDERDLPPVGAHLLVDEEWMLLRSVGPGYAIVSRGDRGSRPAQHEAGSLVHWGHPLTREFTVPTMREDWDL